MFFIFILSLVTLCIAGAAAFFSVYGLASLFSGVFWPVVFMGSSLEAGKLVAASYLHRYWKQTTFLLKLYMIGAIIVLMVITSTGIFGYLSLGYQQDIKQTKENEQQIEILIADNQELQKLKQERLDRKQQIDDDIAGLPDNFVTGRQRLMESYGSELDQLRTDITTYTNNIRENNKKIAELKTNNLEQEAHVGPIIFIAKVFDKNVDDTTKWLIFIIIFAFDPLAVALTLATNTAIAQRRKEKEQLQTAQDDEHLLDWGDEELEDFFDEDDDTTVEDLYDDDDILEELIARKIEEREKQKVEVTDESTANTAAQQLDLNFDKLTVRETSEPTDALFKKLQQEGFTPEELNTQRGLFEELQRRKDITTRLRRREK